MFDARDLHLPRWRAAVGWLLLGVVAVPFAVLRLLKRRGK